MRAKELRTRSETELLSLLDEAQDQLFKARLENATHQLDKRRRVVTIPCSACHESGGHVNVPAARKGYWLCMSPLYRSDEANRTAWDEKLASWRENPNLIEEFLKRIERRIGCGMITHFVPI